MKKNPRTAAHFLKMMLFASATLSTSYIWSSPTHSQNVIALQQTGKIITGKVVDKNNQPLEGVTVYVKGADYGTETNASRVFELEDPENITLVFSYLGYAEVTQTITGDNFLNIVLHEDTEGQLDEIVITALGIARE